MATCREILSTLDGMLIAKVASLKAAHGLDMAGAGDDSPITRGQAIDATQSGAAAGGKVTQDAVSGDAMAQPNSVSGATGSNKAEGKNEANQTDRANTLTSEDKAPVAVAKKDLISGDATAKSASADLANSILSDIRNFKKQAAMPPQLAKAIEDKKEGKKEDKSGPVVEEKKEEAKEATVKPVAKVAATPEETKTEAGKSDSGTPATDKALEAGEAPKATEGGEAPKATKDAISGAAMANPESQDKKTKEAQTLNLELTRDVLAKLAAMLLTTEEGAAFVETTMAKMAGAEAADETFNFLAAQSEQAEKEAAYAQGVADAEELVKQAAYKAGQDAAQADIAGLMQGAGMEQGGDGAAVPAEAMQGGAPEGGELEQMAQGAGDQDLSEEEVAQIMEELVSQGVIDEQTAVQVLQELLAGGAGGGADAGAEGAVGAEGAAPAKSAAKETKAEGTASAVPSEAHEKSEEPAVAKKEEEKAKEVQVKTAAPKVDFMAVINKIRSEKQASAKAKK